MTEVKKSFCHLCLAECGVNVTVDNNKITAISPDTNDKVSQGYICEKAQMLINYQHSKDRISNPLKKINGKFVEISWNQIFDEIGNQLKLINPDRILYMSSTQGINQSTNIYGYELMSKLGVKYLTNVLSFEKAYSALASMNLYQNNLVPDRTNTQTLILLGQNTWITQDYPRARIILNKIKNDPDKKLIVIDPCESASTKIADLHIKLKPSTDSWLLTALIKILIDNNWINVSYINKHTINFKKIKQHFDTIDVDSCLTICGIDDNQLFRLANIIRSSCGFVIDTGMGICHGENPQTSYYLINLLNLLMGNINVAGGLQSYQNLNLFNISKYFKEKFTPVTKQRQIMGIMPAGSVADNLDYMECVIINNSNPAKRLPNSKKFIEKISNVKLVIALDSFMSESVKLADYVLPTPTFFERAEYINVTSPIENTVQISKPIFTNNKVMLDIDIFESILDRLGLLPTLGHWIKLYKEDENEFYNQIEKKFNNNDVDVYYILTKTIGTKYQNHVMAIWWWELYLIVHNKDIVNSIINDGNATNIISFPFKKIEMNNKIDLTPDQLKSSLKLFPTRLANSKYKFILQAGHRNKSSVNTIIGDNSILKIEIFREDAERLSIIDNEKINIETPLLNAEIECKIVDNLQPGLLRLENSDHINLFTDEKNIDYLNPRYKFVFANIRKIA